MAWHSLCPLCQEIRMTFVLFMYRARSQQGMEISWSLVGMEGQKLKTIAVVLAAEAQVQAAQFLLTLHFSIL